MSENMVLNTIQNHILVIFYRFKTQINLIPIFLSVGTINSVFFNEYKYMKDKYFSYNWLLDEQELQVIKRALQFLP